MRIFSFFRQFADNRPHSTYINIFLSIVLSVVISILILTAILYMAFESIIQLHIYTSEKNSLAQTGYGISIMDESARTLLKQMYADTDIARLMYYPVLDSEDLSSGIRRINAYQAMTPFVSSIYIYNSRTNLFYTSYMAATNNIYTYSAPDFYDEAMARFVEDCGSYESFTPYPRKIPLPSVEDSSLFTPSFTYLYYDTVVKSKRVNNAIILNISESWLRKIVQSIDASGDRYNKIYIMDKNGIIITSSDGNSLFKDISAEGYVGSILSSPDKSGYMVEEIDDIESLVIYMKSDFLGWTLVRTIPYNTITYKINEVKESIVLFALIILALGVGVSFTASRIIYKPINSMETRLKSLESEKRKSKSILKQEFMRRLLSGEAEYSGAELAEHMNSFDIGIMPGHQVIVAVIVLDRYEEFCLRYDASDRSLMKFAVMNIASELLSREYHNELCDMGDSYIAALISYGMNTPESQQAFSGLFEEIQNQVCSLLNLSISVAVNTAPISLEYASEAYEESLALSQYRMLCGHKCIIFSNQINTEEQSNYTYPSLLEKSLVEALMLGKVADVKAIYDEIVSMALKSSLPAFNLTITHLAFAIDSSVKSIRDNGGQVYNFNFSSFITQINRMETIDEINRCFYELFDCFAEAIDTKKSSRMEGLLKKVMDIINENYMDPNLSLQSISDSLGMSPAYFSRLFKKYTSKSVVDIINEVRIEKAKALLCTSGMTIPVIVEKTGYTNIQYFYRMFKRFCGVTPSEYRSKHASG